MRATHPKADVGLIERAYAAAEQAHLGQRRKSGDAYITHPLAVATILAELGMTPSTIAAALLHDVGRTETFRQGVTIAVSDEGRLIGHVLAGVRMIDGVAREVGLGEPVLLPLLGAVAGHHGPLEGRRLETPEAVCLYQANQLDARVAESL